jgi:hypothetical protein
MAAKQLPVLADTTVHTHENGELCCDRCNQKVRLMNQYYNYKGLVVGPECITAVMQDLDGPGQPKKVETRKALIRQKFLDQRRRDTIAGMIKRGFDIAAG